MRQFLASLGLISALFACQADKPEAASQAADAERDSEAFIEALWQHYPDWASAEGYYAYADSLSIPDAARRERLRRFARQWLGRLEGYQAEGLPAKTWTDVLMMRHFLHKQLWELDTLQAWAWDASAYNVGQSFNTLLIEDYAPLEERLRSFGHKLDAVPAYFEAAKANLQRPTRPHAELAIRQNQGTLDIFTKSLPDSLARAALGADERQAILQKAEAAVLSIKDYMAWVESYLNNHAADSSAFRDFRLGRERYAEKFAYDIVSAFSADEVYAKALATKAELHGKMSRLARELWPKYMSGPAPADSLLMIRELIGRISQSHVPREAFVGAIREQIRELEAFVEAKQLLRLDPSKPLTVRETPPYMRGFAGASISAPGPYDKNAETYYNVTPLDHYSPEEAESYLREYNDYTLQILNIHEAVPGHYTQLVYANESPSLIKAVLGNGAMIEGWAVYAERMMLEAGYGGDAPEMWLMYYKWHLRVTCNTLLDYGIHVLGWDQAQVMALLREEAFQEQAEAEGKWRRATLSSVQLCSYFTGFQEIYALREALKAEQGADFSLKAFHEQFLSYGSAPVKYIKTLMHDEAR